ncbi:hypothetical protein AUJ44_04165 [Candidatus Nomurabacteria bacterium CG1_02_47_685]|uniref:50S ribosomal protein L28 n=1 Tax=Candidatus Nomurabacteria bacterium CG1_02_47_685 TaxID=1805282 RepID=A0A1J4VAS8_9BACT|nr:MAG: hypothetical protein AUJ44_04165 [Candidatus Nomurabacteria bacterium CG1_02_47_685]
MYRGKRLSRRFMTKSCPICNKGTLVAGGYSNRIRATQFNPTGNKRKYPNLQWARLSDGTRMKICTRCLKAGKHLTAQI